MVGCWGQPKGETFVEISEVGWVRGRWLGLDARQFEKVEDDTHFYVI